MSEDTNQPEDWREIEVHGMITRFVDEPNRFCHFEKEIAHRFKRENDKLYYNVNDKEIKR
jgi:hypothetical protein